VPPLRQRPDDIVHLANIFLHQFAALYRRPAHHFTARAEKELEAYAWPGNVRELQNLVLTSVLFSDASELDVDDLHGLHEDVKPRSPEAVPPSRPSPSRLDRGAEEAGAVPPRPADPALRLREALAGEIAAALDADRTAVAPIGKWLTADLILTADRLADGVCRRGADLLGLPETTYRRQLRGAARDRAARLAVRSAHWPVVLGSLEPFVRGCQSDTDVCSWAESCLIAEIERAVAGDLRTAAALLGVTEVTFRRRETEASATSKKRRAAFLADRQVSAE
jgi:hypothetical protein